MSADTPQVVVSRVFDAPRRLLYRAFTEPEHLAEWWGPVGNSLPRDEIEFDVRPGGFLRWIEVNAAEPELRVRVRVDLTDVADGELLDGVMYVSGRLPEGVEPFETRMRVEFYDESGGRSRLEIRQWLPGHLRPHAKEGWRQAFTKLDAALANARGMAKLIYATNMSLDGYIEDERGAFDWFPVDDEVFAVHTELLRSAGTFLYGRRLYEAMSVWETDPALAALSDLMGDFATAWQAASKVVYSTTLDKVSTAETRLERSFDPDGVRELKATATSDLIVGGANLAAQAFQAGLVDECQLFVLPVVVGGGKPGLPTGMRIDLELLDEHRFRNGVVRLRYRTVGQ